MQSRGQSGDECCDLPIFIEIFFVEQIRGREIEKMT